MRNKLLIATLAVSAAIALACGSAPEVTDAGGAADAAPAKKPSGPKTVQMGQKLAVNAAGLKGTWTVSKAEIRTKDKYGYAPQNGAWLLVFLRVDVSEGEAFTCPCDISLVQKDGKVNEWGTGGLQGRPDFNATQVAAGQHSDGWVVFDVPKSAIAGSKVQLKIMNLFGNDAYGYWTVKV
ncbi:DUF4352 domain-containing protein [Paractinoplanes maris]|uniref:DUF4352 domain-containing protein n=1 Tax=Paractinoplanes maris TaxID=1734446 RepID=UPI00201FCBE2|nr:DUF4352 domain-containing protein [Actinoplanes maris]